MQYRTPALFLSSALAVALATTEANAAIRLDFNKLPSEQGWIYMDYGNQAAESRVFSVSGGVLTQNSIGVGTAPQGSNRYNLFDALTPGLGYTMEIRAQLFAEETNGYPNNHWGFAMGFFDGTGAAFGIGLGNGGVQTDWGFYTGINTQEIHTYKLVGHAKTDTAAASAELWIDGAFISEGKVGNYGSCAPLGTLCNSVYLGDGTGGPNASGAYYSFNMAPIPEPETYVLMLAGLGLVGFAARRRG